jgi:pimeloyl-ACP methyl ester carboxylesterase
MKFDDLDIGSIGTSNKVCLYFALSQQASLHEDPYNQFPLFLHSLGHSIVSITLPFHETDFDLSPWKKAFLENRDILSPFLDKVARFVKPQLEKGALFSVAGLSRGGLVAMLLAAQIKEIKNIVLFAPVLDAEYIFQTKHPLLKKMSPLHMIESFLEKNIAIYVGNNDERINSKYCAEFIFNLAKAAKAQNICNYSYELFVKQSIGHLGHGTSKESFEQGALWLDKKSL